MELVAPLPVESAGPLAQVEQTSLPEAAKESIDVEVQQCCSALADAERTGNQFIALKRFRDLILPGFAFSWANNADERQRVLSKSIEAGAIVAKKIPNPKNPTFPTTSLSLNRVSSHLVQPVSRFRPVPIKGEPGSVTLLQDRGSY